MIRVLTLFYKVFQAGVEEQMDTGDDTTYFQTRVLHVCIPQPDLPNCHQTRSRKMDDLREAIMESGESSGCAVAVGCRGGGDGN